MGTLKNSNRKFPYISILYLPILVQQLQKNDILLTDLQNNKICFSDIGFRNRERRNYS